jgi:hypothetical protein
MRTQRARIAANKEQSAPQERLRRMDLQLSSPVVISVSANGGSMMAKNVDEVDPTDDDTHGGIVARAPDGIRAAWNGSDASSSRHKVKQSFR